MLNYHQSKSCTVMWPRFAFPIMSKDTSGHVAFVEFLDEHFPPRQTG
jgi:hypothetical protein